ncbi:MAG TPA: porin [Geminicoccaceae bacterium]|nr:porin [Geminicoccaceae bacterium]
MLAASQAAAAESEVYVGGYHDEALRAAQNEWLGVGLAEGAPARVPLTVSTQNASALTTFTPRFGGLGLGIIGHAPHAAAWDADPAAPAPGGGVAIGLRETSTVAGVDVDWSAKAGVSRKQPAQAGQPSSFVVGGELAVSGVRFNAAYGERATLLGVSGNQMSAGVAYGFGPVDTRLSYSVVSQDDETAASMLSVGSQLTLQPGLILQGDLAYAQEQDTGDAATAGVVSLRFNF